MTWLLGGACAVIIVWGLRAAAGMLNPMLMAAFLALLFQSTATALRRRGVPTGLAVTLVVLMVVLTGLTMVGFLGASLSQLAGDIPRYSAELEKLANDATVALADRGIDAAAYMKSAIEGPQVGRTVLNISSGIVSGLGNLVLTLFVFAFMLGGMARLEERIEEGAREQRPLAERFLAFSSTIRGYMGVRAVLGVIAAVLDLVLLLVVGVDYALLWAIVSFVFSFVPNIGFTLSVIPPVLLALVGNGWQAALIVLGGYMVINNVIDNVIGPRYVGRQMQMSALLSFVSVIFWAWVLGPTGAILSVPLTVLVRELAFGRPPGEGPVMVVPAGARLEGALAAPPSTIVPASEPLVVIPDGSPPPAPGG